MPLSDHLTKKHKIYVFFIILFSIKQFIYAHIFSYCNVSQETSNLFQGFPSINLINSCLDKHSQRGLSKHSLGDLELKKALKLQCVSQNRRFKEKNYCGGVGCHNSLVDLFSIMPKTLWNAPKQILFSLPALDGL